MIDLLLLSLAAFFGLLGMLSGALKQVSHWIGLALGFLLARPLAGVLAPALAPRLGLPAAAVKVLAGVLCFYALYLGIGWAAHFLLRRAAGDWAKGRWDRAGGFVLGAAKGAVILSVPIALVLCFEEPLKKAWGEPPEPVQSSIAVGFLRRHNPFASMPVPALAKLQKLAEAAQNPPTAETLAGDAKLQELLADPSLKAALGDDSLVKALQAGDWSALQKDPRISALLNDPRIAGQLQGLMELPQIPGETPADEPAPRQSSD